MNLKEAIDVFELDESELLNADKDTRLDIIKKKFKTLAKKYHPDKMNGSDELMSKLNNSYEFLTNYYSKSFGIPFEMPFGMPFGNDPMEEFFNNIIKQFGQNGVKVHEVHVVHGVHGVHGLPGVFNNPFVPNQNPFSTNIENIIFGNPFGVNLEQINDNKDDIVKLKNINNVLRSFIDITKQEFLHSPPVKIRNNFNKVSGKPKVVRITPKEYFTGVVKHVPVKTSEKCICEPILCLECAGGGYTIGKKNSMDVCNNCLGDGWIRNCGKCKYGNVKVKSIIDLVIPKCHNINKLINDHEVRIDDINYYFIGDKLHIRHFITEKESLNGNIKPFEDPFGKIHKINTNGVQINHGDGYKVKIKDSYVILVFIIQK